MRNSDDRREVDRQRALLEYFDEMLERRLVATHRKSSREEQIGRAIDRVKRCLDLLARQWPGD